MKLLISNQHGAIIMALMPFLYGMLLANPIWQHGFLLAAWFALYLMTYPFLNLFKGRNLALYRRWSWIYGVASAIFAIPALWHNWEILYFLMAMLPFVGVNIYYVKRKDERALTNDFAGIVIFALAGMGSYYFSDRTFDDKIWWVALYPTLYFIGTTFYIKSMMRERKNPRYLQISLAYHVICVLILLFLQQYWLSAAFVIPLARAFFLPKKKLSVKNIGLTEIGVSIFFFLMLLLATL